MKRIPGWAIFFLFLLTACTPSQYVPAMTFAQTETSIPPTATFTSTPEPTVTTSPQPTTTSTLEPTFVTLGSPFASNCGDGKTRILFDDSFNGPTRMDSFDDFHGHVDLIPPYACDAESFNGEILAPATGILVDNGPGYWIEIPANIYILGIESVLEKSGISAPDIESISSIKINLAHLIIHGGLKSGDVVTKGQSIGDIDPDRDHPNHIKLAYQINIYYNTEELMFSPTVFSEAQEGSVWLCPKNITARNCSPDFLWYP